MMIERRAESGRLRAELRHVLAGRAPMSFVREDIVASWRQSAAFGVRRDKLVLPYRPEIDGDSPLLRAARPVVDWLGTDLDSTEISVVLADGHSRVVERRVPDRREEGRLDRLSLAPGYHFGVEHAGTNGVGVARATRSPTLVHGDEHFVDVLTAMTSVGTPIRDPRTAHVVGVLALVCSVDAANALMLPVANRAGREIEQRLLNGSSVLERFLDEQFLRARRRARGALALVSPSSLLTNSAAARLLAAVDQPSVWEFATRSLASGIGRPGPLVLPDGTAVNVTVEAVCDGGTEVVGALVRFRPAVASAPPRKRLGWASLTETERGLTSLIAKGLTNREAARRLFLSPHTVDSHLRHIYQKLDINSRVELAVIASARSSFH